MKLKTLIILNEQGNSMGYGSMSSNDTKLRPTPRNKWNGDVSNWDGIVEGKDWFCYMEGNDWHAKRSGATVYINEDDKTHKIWIKIKTGRLRKPNDTNESYKERVRKHTNKAARTWMSAAKKMYNDPEINEAGNPVPITWKHAFREALKDSKLKPYIAECGETEPMVDPVNFTYVKEETGRISYSAVILDDADQQKLLEFFKDKIPSDWNKYAHHMTITMGELPQDKKYQVGEKVQLTAYEIGKSDKAIAVKVKGCWTTNQIPHITLAVNLTDGGKTVDSNNITHWESLKNTIPLNGIIKEIQRK